MDERFTPRPVARWFIVAAIMSLLFGLLISFGYFVHLTTDPATGVLRHVDAGYSEAIDAAAEGGLEPPMSPRG